MNQKMDLEKNRNKSAPYFANINLIGKCNAGCFFCLGKDIRRELGTKDYNRVHFREWKRFPEFLTLCDKADIKRLYITGQNTDALLYNHLGELVDALQNVGYEVGLRTNGIAFNESNRDIIRRCKRPLGLSIHSLIPWVWSMIMGVAQNAMPNLAYITRSIDNYRISIVVTRFNAMEVLSMLHEFGSWCDQDYPYNAPKYVQLRRVASDRLNAMYFEDQRSFETLAHMMPLWFRQVRPYKGAPQFVIRERDGTKENRTLKATLWRTIKTNANSFNYFVDGTISPSYFIVEGYLNERRKEERK